MGIDLEALDAGRSLDVDAFTAGPERERLQAAGWTGDSQEVLHLWCAKEAAAKATGTGLQGRPRALEVMRCEDDGTLVVRHADPPGWTAVRTTVQDGRVLAVAVRRGTVAGRVSGAAGPPT